MVVQGLDISVQDRRTVLRYLVQNFGKSADNDQGEASRVGDTIQYFSHVQDFQISTKGELKESRLHRLGVDFPLGVNWAVFSNVLVIVVA